MTLRYLGLAAISLTLTLSGCSPAGSTLPTPTAPVVTAPATPVSLGRMEVSFTGVGTQMYATSVRPLESGVRGQALTTVAQGLQLRFNSKSSFDIGTAATGGLRYLSATYDVRNASADGATASPTARSNLTFVAVDASAPATISGTAVSNFKRFDGSAADASLAPKIVPTVGMTLTNGVPTVNASQADFQALSSNEVTALGVPNGARDVFQYGFVARNKSGTGRTLPANPGASQFDGLITFAVKLPLQANAANDPYSFSLVFEVYADSANRVTRVPEETAAAAQSRASALGATLVDADTICTVRTASTNTLYGLGISSTGAGGRDACFGSGSGQVITSVTPLQDVIRAMALQPDGKIVVTGTSNQGTGPIAPNNNTDVAVARYLPDGTLDATFGTGGVFTSPVGAGTSADTPQAILRQSDGKFVIAGSTTNAGGTTGTDMFLMRLLPNGSLDSSFGTSGGVMINAGTAAINNFAFGLDQQSDGKLIILGYTMEGTVATGYDIVLGRYSKDGVPDTTFGSNGLVLTSITTNGSSGDRAQDLQVLPDDTIIVVGTTTPAGAAGNTNGNDTVLLKYRANGTLDTSFGGNGMGYSVTAIGPNRDASGGPAASNDIANALVVQPDGSTIVVGGSNNLGTATGQDISVVKFTAAGVLDLSFGTGGKVFVPMVDGSVLDVANAVQRQPDGKLVVSGTTQSSGGPTGQDFALLRLNANGTLDTAFAGTGKELLAVGAGSATDISSALLLQPNGRIVLGGQSLEVTNNTNFALVRVQP